MEIISNLFFYNFSTIIKNSHTLYSVSLYHFVINSYFMKFITSTELNFMKLITSTELNLYGNTLGYQIQTKPKNAKESRLVRNNAKILVPIIKIPCVIKRKWIYKHRFINNRLCNYHCTLWLTVLQIDP